MWYSQCIPVSLDSSLQTYLSLTLANCYCFPRSTSTLSGSLATNITSRTQARQDGLVNLAIWQLSSMASQSLRQSFSAFSRVLSRCTWFEEPLGTGPCPRTSLGLDAAPTAVPLPEPRQIWPVSSTRIDSSPKGTRRSVFTPPRPSTTVWVETLEGRVVCGAWSLTLCYTSL
jgi:hypothetical protein